MNSLFEMCKPRDSVFDESKRDDTLDLSNLLDDSVNAIRTDYIFKRIDNTWKLQETKIGYQCKRHNSRDFQSQKCS